MTTRGERGAGRRAGVAARGAARVGAARVGAARVGARVVAAIAAIAAVLLLALASAGIARADVARISAPRGEAAAAASSAAASSAGAPTKAPTGAAALAPLAADGDVALPVVRARGRILIRAEAGLDDVAAPLAERADAALAEIAADLADLAVPARVEVRVVRDAADLGRAAPPGRGAPTWAAGVAYPDVGVVVVALRRGSEPLDVYGTVAHEMAHLALGAAVGARAPRWLHEGFAWQHSPSDEGASRITTLVGMTWLGSTIPLIELDTSFPEGELPAARAYAESYELVDFLTRRGRWDDRSDAGDREPFRRFLRYLAHGDDLDRAAIRAFGRPMDQLFEEWEADLKSRYLWVPVELFGLLLWLVAAGLLVLAWRRRRRQRRATLAMWAREEAARDARLTRLADWVPTSPVATQRGPGGGERGDGVPDGERGDDDPGGDDDGADDDEPRGPDDRWLN